MENLNDIYGEIKSDPENAKYSAKNIDPLYYAPKNARILIIGQAPGKKAQDTGIVWNDRSGDRLRDWLGIDRNVFYKSGKIAVLPMDFYFPGTGKSGDLPPRKGFAAKWHPRLLSVMPDIQLTLLVGSYAVKHYLHLKSSQKLTNVVKDYKSFLPKYFPLVHSSPRNQIWMKNNPWFEAEVLPDLREKTADILK